jgi:flagellar protein FlgJ
MDAASPSNWYDFGSLAELKSSSVQPSGKTDGKTEGATLEVAQQFESLVLNLMLKEMRKTVSRSGLMDSEAMKTFEQMFDQQVALGMAKAGGIGLGKFIAQQLEARAVQKLDPSAVALGEEGAPTGLPLVVPQPSLTIPTSRVLEQRGLRF